MVPRIGDGDKWLLGAAPTVEAGGPNFDLRFRCATDQRNTTANEKANKMSRVRIAPRDEPTGVVGIERRPSLAFGLLRGK